MLKKILVLLLITITLNAWEGYSYERGAYIEVESYNHQGRGEGDIEYYDYETGDYRTGYLDMYPGGTGTIIDDETGESFDVDMD